MKKTFTISVLCLFTFCALAWLSSCRKQQYACTAGINYFPVGFAFQGFAPDEIDTLILQQYTADGSFSQLLHTDTIYPTAFTVHNDSVYYRDYNLDSLGDNVAYSGYGAVRVGADYRLLLPSLSTTIAVTNVSQGPESSTTYQTDRCSAGATTTKFDVITATFQSPYSITIGHGLVSGPSDRVALVAKP